MLKVGLLFLLLLTVFTSCNSPEQRFEQEIQADNAKTPIADSDTIPEPGDEVFRKFAPKKTFADFPVKEKYTGKAPAKLDFSTCEYGKMYITKTKNALAESPKADFAGHYKFAEWGVGSVNSLCSIIDLKTGKVYAGPQGGWGYDYRVDSRILVVNPPDSAGVYSNCAYCIPEQYLWTGKSFKLLEEADLKKDKIVKPTDGR